MRHISLSPALATLSALVLAACSGSPVADSDSAPNSELPDATTTHYLGTSDGQTPDGSYAAPTEELLFIRIVDPPASSITEQVWDVAERNAVTSYELVHAVDVTTETFTSTWVTEDGTILVTGGYDAGDDWSWTAWHSTSVYQDGTYAGMTITSVDHMDDAGVNTAEKVVFDANGTETWNIVEVLTPCSEEDFDTEFEAVAAGG